MNSSRAKLEVNDVSGIVVDSAITVHRRLGPGLLESAYRACLVYELRKRGLLVRTEVPLPIVYDELRIDIGYRLDVLVEEMLVVELKAIQKIHPNHEAQALSHVKHGDYPVGLLINFHERRLKDGIKRFVNGESSYYQTAKHA